jgi:putative colanic acid biosynthesis acetyltransferase WcaF
MDEQIRPTAQPPPDIKSRIARALFAFVWLIACRGTPPQLHGWRRLVLRQFGAQIQSGAHVYPSVRIWAPWNLHMEAGSCLAPGVECYNVDRVTLGPGAIVSQRAHLCTASHDFIDPAFPLVTAPIRLEEKSWVCAEAFVGPGVVVSNGAVVGARAVVTKSVAPKSVVVGNPSRPIASERTV